MTGQRRQQDTRIPLFTNRTKINRNAVERRFRGTGQHGSNTAGKAVRPFTLEQLRQQGRGAAA